MHLIVNGSALEAPEGATLTQLIELMQLAGRRLAIELNGQIVPRSVHAQTALKPDDRIEIVQAIGGG
ncbi:MAG: sulfur carrier protein ThiS [Panacagrimonas sp.]